MSCATQRGTLWGQEGIGGKGDCGRPALLQVDDHGVVGGGAAWTFLQGDVRTARPGRYGQTSCNVRLSHYGDWIESVISQPQAGAGNA